MSGAAQPSSRPETPHLRSLTTVAVAAALCLLVASPTLAHDASAVPSPFPFPALSPSLEPSPSVVPSPATFPWPTIPAPVEDPDAELDLVPFTPSGRPAAIARQHGVVVRMWLSASSVGQGEWIQALVRTTNTRADPVWVWPGECLTSSTSIDVDLSSIIRPGLPQEGKAAAYKQRAIRASGVLRSGFQRWHPRPSESGVQVSAWAECGGYTFPPGWLKLRPGATTEERFVWYPAHLMGVRWQPLPPGTVTVQAAWRYVGHGPRSRPGRDDRPVHPIVARAPVQLTGVDPGTPSVPELIDRALADPEFRAWVEAHPDDQRGWSADVVGRPGPNYGSGLAGKAPNGVVEVSLQQKVPGVDHLMGVALVDPWTGEVVDVGFQ